ncbi:MAG: hypothetical protein FWG34_04415 [Oscillospiraceae bacterium]|nr:hypothetical protein [Oscillospiraceae bacterium]
MGIEILGDGSLKKIYVTGHSHHDYAWERERQWHILRYCLLFSEVVDWLSENPEATWLIDNAVHSLKPFLENCPEKAKEFAAYVKAGRIEVASGGYSLARPSYVGEETFARNLAAGGDYFKKTLGTGDIPIYYNVDTAPGQRQMPQILKLSGFKYYRFQRPEISLDQRGVPRAFWWKGLDGSEVLVSRGAGVGFFDLGYSNMDYETDWEKIRRAFFDQELAHRRPEGLCPHDVELVPYGCDDSRPGLSWYDREIHINDFVKEWGKKEKTELKFGSAKDYFGELAEKELPVFEGGLDDAELSFNLPAKGDSSMWRMRGDLDKAIVRLESLCAMCAVMGEPYPEDEIEELWMQLFEITGHAIDWVLREDDCELLTIAENAKTKAEIMANKYLSKLAGLVEYGEGRLAAVVNTQAHGRCETVRLCVTSPFGVKDFALSDAAGEEIEYQIAERNSFLSVPEAIRRHDYVSVDVLAQVKTPAFGYNSISVNYSKNPMPEAAGETPDAADELKIDAGALVVGFSKGRITELANKATGRAVKAEEGGSLYGLRCVTCGAYSTWMFENKVTGEAIFAPSSWQLVEKGPIRWRYRICGAFMEGQEAVLDIVINRNSPSIEFELELSTKPLDCYYTADIACGASTKSFADAYFGVEPRDTAQIRYNYGEAYLEGQIYARNFVCFEKDGAPLALISKNCSVYYVHEPQNRRMSLFLTRNCIYENSSEDWARKLPKSFALDGKNHFQFALMSPEKYGAFGDVQQYAKNYHHPLSVGKKYNQNKGGAPASDCFVENPAENIVQSAIYKKNGRMYIRCFETNGKETKMRLKLPKSAKAALPVDLLGRPLACGDFFFDAAKHTAELTVGSFKIVTIEVIV